MLLWSQNLENCQQMRRARCVCRERGPAKPGRTWEQPSTVKRARRREAGGNGASSQSFFYCTDSPLQRLKRPARSSGAAGGAQTTYRHPEVCVYRSASDPVPGRAFHRLGTARCRVLPEVRFPGPLQQRVQAGVAGTERGGEEGGEEGRGGRSESGF